MKIRRAAAEQSAPPEAGNDARRTISVVRRRTRLPRLRVEYPERDRNGPPRIHYEVALARELLSRTAELPGSKRGLLAVLTKYRHALAAFAAGPHYEVSAVRGGRRFTVWWRRGRIRCLRGRRRLSTGCRLARSR